MNKLNCILVGLFLVVGFSLQGHGQTNDTLVNEKEMLNFVEVIPEFPGGQEALNKFLQSNLKYPKEAIEANKEGRVMVKFVVKTDGSITDVTVSESIFKELDEEAVRVVKLMPKWKPGMLRGKTVNVRFSLPVEFKLNN